MPNPIDERRQTFLEKMIVLARRQMQFEGETPPKLINRNTTFGQLGLSEPIVFADFLCELDKAAGREITLPADTEIANLTMWGMVVHTLSPNRASKPRHRHGTAHRNKKKGK